MKKSGSNEAKGGTSPSQHIDARIKELGDWRGEMLARIRSIIKQADPDVVEEWKWRGVPVWEHDGIICTGETYKAVVKMTFAKGAALDDPSDLFNSSLEGNTRRAIDFHEGDKIDEKALKALIREAVGTEHFGASCRGRKRALERTTATNARTRDYSRVDVTKLRRLRPQLLKAHNAARNRTGRHRRRARQPDLSWPGTSRKIAVDRAHRHLVGSLGDAGTGVHTRAASRLDQFDAHAFKHVKHSALHAIVADILAAELEKEACAGSYPHAPLRRPFEHGMVMQQVFTLAAGT